MMKNNRNIPHIENDERVMLFDGLCKLCNIWARFIIRYDKKVAIKLVSMQSDKGQAILQSLGKNSKDYETILFIENNYVYEKSNAFFKIIHHLPYPIRTLTFFKYIPRSISDFTYDQIARNRYKIFGKHEECILPKSEEENRFL